MTEATTAAHADAWSEANNIGNVLLRRGALTVRQIAMVAERQVELRIEGKYALFGDVCIELGYCTRAEVDGALEDQRRALAPPSNEEEVQEALADLDRVVDRAKATSERFDAVTREFLEAEARSR